MNKGRIILTAIVAPISTLALLMLTAEFARKYGLQQIADQIDEVLNVLFLWPMFLYETLAPEPIGGWEGFRNGNGLKFIIAASTVYSSAIFSIIHRRQRRRSNSPL